MNNDYSLTLAAAQKLPSYNFNNKYDQFQLSQLAQANPDESGFIVLEVGYVDIEINIVANNVPLKKGTHLEYYCCIKCGDLDSDWESFGPISSTPNIKKLELDMFTQLIKFAKKNKLSILTPNTPR